MAIENTGGWGVRSCSIFAAATLLAGASAAFAGPSATPEPFASFQNGNFIFTNNVTSAVLNAQVSPPLQPTFIFDEPVTNGVHTYAANQPIPATMTFTATSSASASGSPIVDQPLGNGTWSFTDPYGDNLLTLSNITGNLFGELGGSAENLVIDTTNASLSPLNTLTYTSDFLAFSPNNVGMDSTGLTLDNGSNVSVGESTGYLYSLTANGDGTFSAVLVPEPTTLGLIGITGFMLLAHRRRA